MEKTFQQAVTANNRIFKQETDAIFKKFYSERKKLKIDSIADSNKLFNKKYKKEIEKIEKYHAAIYKRIWSKFNK